MNFSTGTTNAFLKKLADFLGRKLIGYHAILAVNKVCPVVTLSESQCKELFKSPGLCSEMEVNLAPNKINLITTMQLVNLVTKKEILNYPVVKMTTN